MISSTPFFVKMWWSPRMRSEKPNLRNKLRNWLNGIWHQRRRAEFAKATHRIRPHRISYTICALPPRTRRHVVMRRDSGGCQVFPSLFPGDGRQFSKQPCLSLGHLVSIEIRDGGLGKGRHPTGGRVLGVADSARDSLSLGTGKCDLLPTGSSKNCPIAYGCTACGPRCSERTSD